MLIYIDCGAYIGDTVALALLRWPQIDLVYAIEPHPDSMAQLAKRFASDPRVMYVPRAVSGGDKGEALLHLSQRTPQGHSLRNKKGCTGGTLSVLNMRLSDLLLRFEQANADIMLKMDIEGSEYDVIPEICHRGAVRKLRRVWVKWNKKRVGVGREEHERVVAMLNKHGFGLTGENRHDEFSRQT